VRNLGKSLKITIIIALVIGLTLGIMYGGILFAVIGALLGAIGAYKLREYLRKRSRFYRKYILMETEKE
jgi:uncharacterized membrane protein